MQREEKSERSRRAVLDAALYLFSHQGFRATTMRQIAERADLSTGNCYHHFPDKEKIFRELIDEYLDITRTERFPFTKVLYGTEQFPDNIEQLGYAARDSVRQFRGYLALVYVDVIEFGGTHIQKLYANMADRYTEFFERMGTREIISARLRPHVSPASALLLTSRLFFNYFSLEILFGVPEPFGKSANDVVKEIADIIRNGVCEK
jgi:AcrR family transcriptional regulator